jgi:hypothetical protein
MVFMKRRYLQRDVFWVRTLGSCGLFSYDGNALRYLSAGSIDNISQTLMVEKISLVDMNIDGICRIFIDSILNIRFFNHSIIRDIDHIQDFYFMNIKTPLIKYDLDHKIISQIESMVGPPRLLEVENGWVLRFVTVCGSAQYYRNLGLETFFISRDFDIHRKKRITFCENMFTRIPYRIA